MRAGGGYTNKVDLIVVRIGENVTDIEAFEKNIQRLIDKCLSYTERIIITGCFWYNAEKERILIDSALDNDLRFVSLGWIAEIKDVYPVIGDSLYDVKGNQYVIKEDFIITHPNDKGMELIAESIFNAMTFMEFSCQEIE